VTHGGGAFLVAMQQADSQFPSGGFAFSQGLEASVVEAQRVGPFDLSSFIAVQVRHRWMGTDRVAVARAHRLADDLPAVAAIDQEFEASSIFETLREGSRRNGAALLTAHQRLGTRGADEYRRLVRQGRGMAHLPVVQGLVWRNVGLDEQTALAVSGYQAVASLASAAVRLGVVGAIEAQARIAAVLPLVALACAEPVADDQPFEAFVPLTEIAVSLNHSSGQRLFSN
jgi:urease accessory protein